jgi:hypothetical protein
MDLLDFYRDIKLQNSIIDSFFQRHQDEEKGYPTNSVESLSFYMTNMTKNVIAYIQHYMEDDDELCYKCIYHKMDMSRKSITRYLIIETEDKGDYESVLTEAREKMNEWCKYIISNFDMKRKEEHIHIENTAYSLIQLELDEDDVEDDVEDI